MDSTTVSRPPRSGFRSALAWIAIVGLFAVVVWLVSERNARTWYLVPDEGRLVVMRGLMAPLGRRTFESSDPVLAQAYAPLVAPPGRPPPAEASFDDRAQLDQALYDLLAGWAREEIASGDGAHLERGLGYVARAERLPGVSPAQREDLLALRAESGFHEALKLVDKAAEELRDAAEKLRRAAASHSPHATDAAALLRDVDPAVQAALGAVRAAKASAPPPAPAPAAAQAAPAPASAPESGR